MNHMKCQSENIQIATWTRNPTIAPINVIIGINVGSYKKEIRRPSKPPNKIFKIITPRKIIEVL